MQGACYSNVRKIRRPQSHSQVHKKCRLHNESTGALYLENKSTSWKPAKIPARVGPKAEPIEIPSTCLYMMLSKLNSTDVVANFINSTLPLKYQVG